LLAEKVKCSINDVKHVTLWGNHSPTMFPDLSYAQINGRNALDLVGKEWYEKTFIPRVQKRGAEIIEARGLSSAASAANAAIIHMRNWWRGYAADWSAFAVWSNGNRYKMPEGIFYSFPVTVNSRY
jgi:malate dehydrogenase